MSSNPPGNRKKRPTQSDVARVAKVSQAMVSYVLNDNAAITVPDETRHRILDAIRELGYKPNQVARSLRSSKTCTLAVIIPDITNPFYPAFARGIQDVADAHNYDIITYNTDGLLEKERKCIDSVAQGRVDGVIAVLFNIDATKLFPLLDQDIPVVRLEATRKEAGERPLDNIYLDNVTAARAAVHHLIDRGHTQIGMIAGRGGPIRYRVQGYREALTEAGLTLSDSMLEAGDFNEVGGYYAMQVLLQRQPRCTAVFAANDLMAMGAYMAIKENGMRIPDDVAVVGFDNIPSARLVSPQLTTIDPQQHALGRRAAEMLYERIMASSDSAPKHGRSEQHAFELLAREST